MSRGISWWRLVLREMQASKLNTLCSLLVVAVAAAMLVAMVAVGQASVDATRILMKNMGFNLLITPKGTDPARYQILDFPAADMPEEYVRRLAEIGTLPAEHFVGKYQKRVEIQGETAVLTGVMAEVGRTGSTKKPMPTAYEVKPGEVYLGSAIAARLGLAEGGALVVDGKSFLVGKVLEQVGAMPEDIRVYADLHEVQAMEGRPGRINAIDALSCQCDVVISDLLKFLSDKIREVLPEVEVTAYNSILLARHRQRTMAHLLGLVTLGLVMAASATAVWGLTYQNVHGRRYEIGVLRALGMPGWKIAGLFLAKIMLYSALGAALGCAAGQAVAQALQSFQGSIAVSAAVCGWTVALAPVVAALFGLPPIVSRLLQPPVEVLGDRGA